MGPLKFPARARQQVQEGDKGKGNYSSTPAPPSYIPAKQFEFAALEVSVLRKVEVYVPMASGRPQTGSDISTGIGYRMDGASGRVGGNRNCIGTTPSLESA